MPGFTTNVGDALDLENGAAVTLAVSAAAAQTPVLAEGRYDVWCTVDVLLKVAATANDVTAANGYLLRTGSTRTIAVRVGSRIGAIAAGSGTLSYHKVG